MNETDITTRFGLAGTTYRAPAPGTTTAISSADALKGVNEGLATICDALKLAPAGVGMLWRDATPWPIQPRLKVVVWGARRPGEEGNYAPACGTINLFGGISSLFHEFAHAIDFGFPRDNGTPWSHGEAWCTALSNTPDYCAHAQPPPGKTRIRLSQLYLATPHEMFARAFECYVLDKISDPRKHKSTHQPDCADHKTYPQGAERAALSQVIDNHIASRLRTTP